MVSTSILPGRGTTELSATPKRINPGPPKWRNHRHSRVILKNKRMAGIQFLRSSLSPMSGTGSPRITRQSAFLPRLRSSDAGRRAEYRILRHSEKKVAFHPGRQNRDNNGYSESNSF